LFELARMQALQMCGREGGSRVATRYLLKLDRLPELHVLQQMLLR